MKNTPRLSIAAALCLTLLISSQFALAARLFERQDGIPSPVEVTNFEGRKVVVPEKPWDLGGLLWVWSEEDSQPDFGLNAYYLTPPGARFFRRAVELKGQLPKSVKFVVAAAGAVTLRLNGEVVAEGLAPRKVHVIDVSGPFLGRQNIFGIEVDTSGQPVQSGDKEQRMVAGLIGRLIFEYHNGRTDIVPVDQSWQVSATAQDGWDSPQGTAPDWVPAIVMGPYGIEPFGQIAGPLIPPPMFPHFVAPGFERPMDLWREMGLRYFRYGSVPTYKDIWMPESYLWVGLVDPGQYDRNEVLWKQALLQTRRFIDEEGYVSTDQHLGLGHPHGWPFPFWMQAGGAGWPFSHQGFHYLEQATIRPEHKDPSLWTYHGVEVLGQDDPEGVELRLTAPDATMDSPAININHRVSPFFTMEWDATSLEGKAAPYLEWKTASDPQFSAERRVPFSFDADARGRQRSVARLYDHARYDGPITGFRIGFGNEEADKDISVKILFTTQDTRHNGNNAQFIGGVHDVFAYTGDTDWLRAQMPRVRKALRFALDEFQVRELKHVRDPWIGHEGRSGIEYVNGKKVLHRDRGMGNNFWDLLPFGGNDFYTSMLMFVALQRMANLEELVAKHPDWQLGTDDAFDPEDLRNLAREMKDHANEYFWNEETGRFPAAIDFDGVKWDYGFTFVNLEAIYYGFATDEHARNIMEWITGVRNVEGDTSQGADIYHWRFAPRATTRRNIDYYKFAWSAPERLNFGDQVQDGGAVFGFSYHDLMARQRVMGPDVAWEHLLEILEWYDEVWEAGGYMPYYEVHEGTLQSPLPGGLGLHREFTEPSLIPLYALRGLFGWEAFPDGFLLDPHFPTSVRDFRLDRIRFQDALLALHYKEGTVSVELEKGSADGLSLRLPPGDWEIAYFAGERPVGGARKLRVESDSEAVPLFVKGSNRLTLRGRSDRVAELEMQIKKNADRWAQRPPVPRWSIGEAVRRFNFGPPDAPSEDGWTLVGKEQWSADQGFGWETPPDSLLTRPENEVKPNPRTQIKSQLPRERSTARVSKEAAAPAVFRVDLEPGTYEVLVAAGDLGESTGVEIRMAESGEQVLADRVVAPGTMAVVQRKVDLPDGILRLEIPAPRLPNAKNNSLSWLEIRKAERIQ